MTDGKVVIDTMLNTQGFSTGVKNLKGELGGLGTVVKKLGGLMVAAFSVGAIVNFGKQSIELGSNVAEVQNVVDVAFGDMAYKIEEFADSSIQNFGMSRLAAKKTASTYMAMAKGMGISGESASNMAISLTGLSGDVASFFNISQELADTKLKSVFTGETETLKDLGVVMTQANLKAFALEQGITKDISAMSQAELVGLRYNFVINQLSLANGDFARTSDSWANQTRILSMQWQEFMSIMGQALIQVLTPVVKVLNTIVSALISMANTFNSVVSGLFGGANTQIQQTTSEASGVGAAIGESVENQDALTDSTKKTAKAQNKLLAGFDELNKISDSASSSGKSKGGTANLDIPPVNTAAVSLEVEDAGGTKLLAFFRELREALEPSRKALASLWEQLKVVGSFAGDALVDFYVRFLKPVGTWVLGVGLPRFITAIRDGLAVIDWQRINNALSRLWDALAPFAIHVGEGLLWFRENVLVPLGSWVVNEIVPRFLDIVAIALEGLNNIIEYAKPGLQWMWENFLQPVGQWAGEVFVSALDVIIGLFQTLVGILTGDFDMAMEGVTRAVQGLKDIWEQLKTAALTVVSAIKDSLSSFVGWVNLSVVQPVTGFFKGLWDGISELATETWSNIKSTFKVVADWFKKNVIDPVTTKFKGFINGLIGFVEGFVNFFIRGINGIIDAFNNLSFTTPDWVPVIGGKTFGINIPTVSELSLPRLATGAVIPPNREFLAVLGDQKSGTNLEAPEGLLRKIVREEMAAGGGSFNEITLRLVSDRSFVRTLKLELDKESQRKGVKLVRGMA